MPRMTNANSADLLNDTDRLERILDWQLFTIEQEELLWGGTEYQWKPGAPIHQDPRFTMCWHFDRQDDCRSCMGEIVRPMVEEYSDGRVHQHITPKCEDCQVWWDYTEEACWVCGVVPPTPKLPTYEFKTLGPLAEEADENWRSFYEYVRQDMAVSLRRLSDQMVVYGSTMRNVATPAVERMRESLVEATRASEEFSLSFWASDLTMDEDGVTTIWEWSQRVRMTPIPRSYPRQPRGPRPWFTWVDEAQPEPVPDTQAVTVTDDDGVRHELILPRNYSTERAIPMPEGPILEVDLTTNPYWVGVNSPLTERRRSR